MTVVTDYARFASAMRSVNIPEKALHHAKRSLIDWFACVLPGGLEPPATFMADAFSDETGRGTAVLLPSGVRATARTAALINGTAAHTIEFDDIFRDGLYHPGSPVGAAVLASGGHVGADGQLLLRGIISGYEVSNRIAMAVVPAHYDWWHTTGTVGFFGAAAAASTILGLSEEESAHAIATVGTMAAGLQQAFRSDAMSKPIHSGRAAEGGVLAAQIAKRGVTGALDVLEGERGFGNAMSRDVDWAAAVEGLGEDFTVTRMTQKKHAACGHLHAAVDAVIEMKGTYGLVIEDVAAIRVTSYQKAQEICGNANPKTPYEAKFSTAYCTALALRTGQALRTDDFTVELLDDPVLCRLMPQVTVEVDADCQATFPKVRSARVEIETIDGRTLTHFARTRRGDPDNPLSDKEISDKYTDLASPVVGEDHATVLLKKLWRLDGLASVHDLSLSDTVNDEVAAD